MFSEFFFFPYFYVNYAFSFLCNTNKQYALQQKKERFIFALHLSPRRLLYFNAPWALKTLISKTRNDIVLWLYDYVLYKY